MPIYNCFPFVLFSFLTKITHIVLLTNLFYLDFWQVIFSICSKLNFFWFENSCFYRRTKNICLFSPYQHEWTAISWCYEDLQAINWFDIFSKKVFDIFKIYIDIFISIFSLKRVVSMQYLKTKRSLRTRVESDFG